MTATGELRRLLDERGVEWGNIRNDGSESDYLTEWQFEGIQSYAVATEWAVGGGLSLETHRHHLTPAQAIAATLRSGTCCRLPADNFGTTCVVRGHGYEMEFGYWKCSECGTNCFDGARYCMNCGARVVDAC